MVTLEAIYLHVCPNITIEKYKHIMVLKNHLSPWHVIQG